MRRYNEVAAPFLRNDDETFNLYLPVEIEQGRVTECFWVESVACCFQREVFEVVAECSARRPALLEQYEPQLDEMMIRYTPLDK